MKLSTWIGNKGGATKAAVILGTERNRVHAWKMGIALPRADMMKAIVLKTRGKVGYADMVDEYLAKNPITTKKKKPAHRISDLAEAGRKAFTPKTAKKKGKPRGIAKSLQLITAGKMKAPKKKKIDPGF